MKKVLILDANIILKDKYLNIDICKPYLDLVNTQQRIYRKVWNMFRLGKSFWYGEWRKYVCNYDVIIINDTFYDAELIRFINRLNPAARKIMHYYNPIASLSRMKYPQNIDRSIIELWSVDRVDCQKYDMKYNCLPFEGISASETMEIKWDVVFIGLDKGRAEYVKSLFEIFNNMGLRTFCFIYPSYGNIRHLLWIYYNEMMSRKYRLYMDYQMVLEYSANSNAILEILQDGQACYTLRTMEALFLNKKLITNNKHLVQEEFYNPKRMFILGVDNIERIRDFVSCETEPVPKDLLDKYSYDNWLRNFGVEVMKNK